MVSVSDPLSLPNVWTLEALLSSDIVNSNF